MSKESSTLGYNNSGTIKIFLVLNKQTILSWWDGITEKEKKTIIRPDFPKHSFANCTKDEDGVPVFVRGALNNIFRWNQLYFFLITTGTPLVLSRWSQITNIIFPPTKSIEQTLDP
jgi:hypothetical protein